MWDVALRVHGGGGGAAAASTAADSSTLFVFGASPSEPCLRSLAFGAWPGPASNGLNFSLRRLLQPATAPRSSWGLVHCSKQRPARWNAAPTPGKRPPPTPARSQASEVPRLQRSPLSVLEGCDGEDGRACALEVRWFQAAEPEEARGVYTPRGRSRREEAVR